MALDTDQVIDHEPGSTEANTPDGRPICNLADGAIFTTEDDQGVAAWAAAKTTIPFVAHDVRVEVRNDVRRRGLERIAVSHAIQSIIDSGVTPLYMHVENNTASAQLGRSLAFQPYGAAVFAETSLP